MSETQTHIARNELELLQTFRWPGGLVTSCYLQVDGRQWPGRAGLISQLNSMMSKAKADLDRREASHESRTSVRDDLRALEDWLQQHLPERSGAITLAWFSCSAHGIQVARWLPIPLPNRLVLAEDFDDSALLAALRSVPHVGLVVIDHSLARVYHADVTRIGQVAALQAEYQEKIRPRETTFGCKAMMPDVQFGRGNLHEKRVQNRRDHLLHRHVDTVVPRLSRVARENGWSHLFLAGEDHAVSALRNRLTADLRRLDVQVVDLPAKADATAVRNFLRAKMDELRHERFRHEYDIIMNQTIPQMRATGLEDVCRAATLNAIQLLLLEAAPPQEGKVCGQCGWLGVDRLEECPLCQSEPIQSPHIYDNLADTVLASGGDVIFSEKQVLPPSMKHVAARLRFPLGDGL